MDATASRRLERLMAHLGETASEQMHIEAQAVAGDAEARLKQFNSVYDTLASDIITELSSGAYDMPGEAIQYVKRMMDYTVPGGKMNRGLSVLDTFKVLVNRPVTDQEVFKACVLGWLVEWLQAFFLVADDLMDSSVTRRGAPCWYKLPDVGLNAANDSLILEAFIYKIAKKYFRNEKYYISLVELMQEVTYKTELGQMLDLRTAVPNKVDFTNFTIETYRRIVKYKTAFYSFYLPVALALLMAGYDGDDKVFDTAASILLPMGEYFQIQDDFLDCYGDEKTIGKIGTDIQDNKCGWLIIQALKRASPAQRKVLESCYAKHDAKAIAAVKQVYAELNMKKIFTDYEDAAYAELQEMIKRVDCMPRAVFDMFLAKIFKRKL